MSKEIIIINPASGGGNTDNQDLDSPMQLRKRGEQRGI